jgi:hypothetical protein
MSRTFEQIQDLVGRGEIRISEHGYNELAMDDIFVDAIFAGVAGGLVIEDYPNYHKGPCVLVFATRSISEANPRCLGNTQRGVYTGGFGDRV